ncbi:NUDIX hydrolase [Lapillicoccus sp.]|uniref:NUDIX hydrolase n=1 Tax=Lapillicoccus sp. TaxID=1909287 RepID=UPI003262D962
MTDPGPPPLTDGVVVLTPDGRERFSVVADGTTVGHVTLRELADSTGELTWGVDDGDEMDAYASRAVSLVVSHAFDDRTLLRVQAKVAVDDGRSVRAARGSGLRNEGRIRAADGSEYLLLARLRDDAEPQGRAGFRALLNSFLPRTRVISQVLVRDEQGRVLLCHPTYKDDWDLPGGVVERLESPHTAAGREVVEELALDLPIGPLLLTDWLPPWGGWDDAVCTVFDAGVHAASVLDAAVLQAREIREIAFCTLEEVHDRAADFTARRVMSALAALAGDGPAYTESGRPV